MKFKALLIGIGSVSVFAGTTGSIMISGTVPAVTAITVSPVSGYNNLDLTTTQSNTQVANITEINNTTNGYTVTLSSNNSGVLKNGSIGVIAYTAKYNNVSVTLSSSPVVITNVGVSSTIVNNNKSLTVGYTGVASQNLMQGTYSDTLTFTIIAN